MTMAGADTLTPDVGHAQEQLLQDERRVIHLMLSHSSAVQEVRDAGITSAHFDDAHRLLVDAIFDTFADAGSGRLLTRQAYQHRVMNSEHRKNVLHYLKVYDLCYIGTDADLNDLGYLKEQVNEGHAGRSLRRVLRDLRTTRKERGFRGAIEQLTDDLVAVRQDLEPGRTLFPAPTSLAAIPADKTKEPLWEGILFEGDILLLVGIWKSGKTRLICSLLKAITAGVPFGRETRLTKALVLSEETDADWLLRRDSIGFPETMTNNVQLLTRTALKYQRNNRQWADLVRHVERFCRQGDIGLVVIDSLVKFCPYQNENDAAEIQPYLDELDILRAAGVATILVHHCPKRTGEAASISGRGSGAISAFTDCDAELKRKGEFAELLWEGRQSAGSLSFKWNGSLYVPTGSEMASAKMRKHAGYLHALKQNPSGLTAKELLNAWDSEYGPRPAPRTVNQDLEDMAADALVVRSGSGRKNDPFRFSLSA